MLPHSIAGRSDRRGGRVSKSRAGGFDRWLPRLTPSFALFLVALVALANSGQATSELLRIVRAVPGGDKTVHFFLAGTMALLLNLSWRGSCWRIGPLPIQKGSVVVALLCTLEEYSQLYMRVRAFDTEDLLYDYLGILTLGQIGVWIHVFVTKAAAGKSEDEA